MQKLFLVLFITISFVSSNSTLGEYCLTQYRPCFYLWNIEFTQGNWSKTLKWFEGQDLIIDKHGIFKVNVTLEKTGEVVPCKEGKYEIGVSPNCTSLVIFGLKNVFDCNTKYWYADYNSYCN